VNRNAAIAWARHNAIALLALFVAMGGTAYAATAINGKLIKNGTITGKKLKADTLGGTQVKESTLGIVPSAARADSAVVADTARNASTATNATNAGSALTAQTAATLGSFGPDAFARASQFQVSGPFETDPETGTDQTFFSFPEIGFTLRTPRAPNKPGNPGLVQVILNADPGNLPIVRFHTPSYDYAARYATGEGGIDAPVEGGINWPVNHTGAEEDEDFLDITVFSPTSDLVVWIECVAEDNVADIPVTCVASKSKP
jgi:hypothetical protein